VKEPRWLTEEQILAIHERLLSEHGGLAGVRDQGLLESALDRPRNLFAYKDASIYDIAGAYAHGIVKNHPFLDGNKRTAFIAAYVFLAMQGRQLIASEEKAVTAMLALAAGEMTQQAFSKWLEQESEPMPRPKKK
jgi:death-on-curing protein